MIAFGPDTEVSATPVQRYARGGLRVGCLVLGLGVISSVARLAVTPAAVVPRPHLLAVDDGQFPAMAAGRTVAAVAPRPVEPTPVELLSDTPPAAVAAKGDRTVWMLVTAYCPCPKCCGKHAMGLTASGHPTGDNYGHFVAAPAELPFGSHVTVPGYNRGRPVPVYDRGGAIKGSRLDVFFPSHEKAQAWGRRWVAVTITGG